MELQTSLDVEAQSKKQKRKEAASFQLAKEFTPLSMEIVEYVNINTLGCGSIRLGTNYCRKQIIEDLCRIVSLVLINQLGDEIVPDSNGWFRDLQKDDTFTAADEADLASSDEETDPYIRENKARIKMINIGKRIIKMQLSRKALIQAQYIPKHPHVYRLEDSAFVPSFLDALKAGSEESRLAIMTKETETGIYSFALFNSQFCKDFLEEIENFESTGLPLVKPNTMNNYGVVLEELGFNSFFDTLREKYMKPFMSLLYGQLGAHVDSQHPFIVQYKLSEDKHLDFHYDESEVTLNVCLGKQFTGGSLYFCGLLEDKRTHNEMFEYVHSSGKAILHIGKHRHGAKPIQSGERFNLIVWFRDIKLREDSHTCECCQVKHAK